MSRTSLRRRSVIAGLSLTTRGARSATLGAGYPGAVHRVSPSASATLTEGDVVFGQVVPISGIALVEAVAPFAFPPVYKTHLIQVRHRGELRQHADMALRAMYFSLAEAYLNPPRPKLHNTDDEPLEPRTLYFELESAQRAFDALAPLALGSTREQLLESAKFDVHGALVEAEIPWVRRNDAKHALETVVLGRIRIVGRKLSVEVNSAERARAFRRLIPESPGLNARYRRTRKHPIDAALAAPPPAAGGTLVPRDADQAELMQHPEVRAHLERLQRRHYESWPQSPLPALNGKTPFEAVEEPDGREMVEALITQFERDASRMPVPTDPEVFARLRQRLGL